ncbi:hypothetical protein [Capnocytophaga leadbetteri]|jgi:hypothetical protein|uniref:hypothetical protein n=2 Tax=Capnocytophaga leadbetteri TaxID=327575 RepID=UPI0028D7F832|nr:hypothetical protein [Capnocytophaga leadbetteri]
MQAPLINDIVDICVPLIAVLLGTAYPIILNNISNIGEKYKAKYLLALFNYERFQKKRGKFNSNYFEYLLYISLFLLLFLILELKPLFGWNNWFINNSAKLSVVISTISLIIVFILWLKEVIIYTGDITNLFKYLTKEYHKESETDRKQYILMSINEITINAVEKNDKRIEEDILNFYTELRTKLRKEYKDNLIDKDKSNKEGVLYPFYYHEFIRELIKVFIEGSDDNFISLQHHITNGSFLIPNDFQYIKISEDTYNNLWYNITLIRNNTDFISKFWAHSNQYFWMGLKEIVLNFDKSNEKKFIEREEERKRFLEFHYAVGGLLLYSKNYESLKYIFSYSQQSPPDYKLLPYDMKELFEWIEFFRNEYKQIPKFFIGYDRYRFPNLDSVGTNKQVVFWICRYLCVLFIRQYKLLKTLYYSNTTNQPYLNDLPLMELYNWKESITYFKFCLNKVLEDKEALEQLELWNTYELKYSEIDKFIIELEQSIDEHISDRKERAELSQKKIEQFYASSKEILGNCLEEYLPINNPEDFDTDFKVTFSGESVLFNKSCFVDDDIPCMDYDSNLANIISRYSIKKYIPNSFLGAETKSYLLNNNNLLKGIGRIINDKEEDIVIIIFNAGDDTSQKLSNSQYKEKVISLPATDLRNTIFILEKSNLPKIEKSDISEEVKQELQVKKISDKWNIYGTIIDINLPKNEAIKEKWIDDINYYQKENKLQILLGLLFVGHIKFKSDRKIIQININNEFEELGTENKLSDLEPL